MHGMIYLICIWKHLYYKQVAENKVKVKLCVTLGMAIFSRY